MAAITLVTTFLVYALWGVVSLFISEELLSIPNIIGAFIIVSLLYWIQKPPDPSWTAFLFPRRVWAHPSAKLDVWYYMVIQAISVGVLAPIVVVLTSDLGALTHQGWQTLAASPALLADYPQAGAVVHTLLVFMALDFAFFYSHYLSHKYPLLWAFHKVHHSARVLVPFTAMRFHPFDMFWNMLWGAVCVGLMDGFSRWLLLPEAQVIEFFDNNMVVALSYITFHILRHSHIWVTFPTVWLISPAQHQLHHSLASRHWNKNFGYLLGCWDRWFGTLYQPTHKEDVRYGIPDMPEDGARSHTSIKCLLLTPMREAWELIRKPRKDVTAP